MQGGQSALVEVYILGMHIVTSTPEEFARYFEGVRARTLKLVPLIPAPDLEWRAAPGAFSFGDTLRHLAGLERWMWAENVCGRPVRYPGHSEELARGAGAVRAYLDALHRESMEIFRNLTEEAFHAPVVTPGQARMPAWKWLRAMIEHEAHHRGQLYLMLRMRGIATPPIFGLTSEEVRARSLGSQL